MIKVVQKHFVSGSLRRTCWPMDSTRLHARSQLRGGVGRSWRRPRPSTCAAAAAVFAVEGGSVAAARVASTAGMGATALDRHAFPSSAGARRWRSLQFDDDHDEEDYSEEGEEYSDEGDQYNPPEPAVNAIESGEAHYELDANKVELQSAGVWGGECTCPDGQSYFVGDEVRANGSTRRQNTSELTDRPLVRNRSVALSRVLAVYQGGAIAG